MDTETIIGIIVGNIPLLIALGALIVAVYANKISKRQMFYPAVFYLQNEYRTPEMFEALRRLWMHYDFAAAELGFTKKEKGVQLTKEEEKIFRERIKSKYKEIYLKEKKDDVTIKDTFDNQRRIVSHFFLHLNTLKKLGILDEEHIKSFSSDVLLLLEKIIIPIEEQLEDILDENRPWVHHPEIIKGKESVVKGFEEILRILKKKDC